MAILTSSVEVQDGTGAVERSASSSSSGRRARGTAAPRAKDVRAAKRAVKKKRKSERRRGFSIVPWILTLTLAAGAGFGGYYMYEKYQLSRADLAETRAELVAAHERAAASEDQVMQMKADLSKARGEFAAVKEVAEKKAAEVDELTTKLQGLITKEQGEVTQGEDGKITLELMDKILFDTGEAELTDKGMAVLKKVGDAVKATDKQVWVQGHTDDVPIANEQFGSNWELSAARALNVVHFLQIDVGVQPRRLAAVAFGEYRPVSRQKRFKNRRIEIVLYPPKLEVLTD